jgi:hypothetical protein
MYLSFLGAAASAVVWLRPIGIGLALAGLTIAAWRYLHEPKRAPHEPQA